MLAITVQVGRTGVLTPVAELAPVRLAGSTIARATLHNREEITRSDLRVGDYVYVEKAGEIIPVIVGVNTANPLVWKDGRITPAQLDRLHRAFDAAPDRRRIVAMHHPIEGPPGEPRALAGATGAAAAFAAMGVEIVLSGHLHFTYAAPLTLAPGVLSVQAGTCVSTRTRSDGNAFSMLDLGDNAVTLTHIRAQPDKTFRADADWTLRREGGRWTAPGL